jgi:hypothetical protein
VHLNALHLKLILVQRMLQQNVVMCLTLTSLEKIKWVREWEIN